MTLSQTEIDLLLGILQNRISFFTAQNIGVEFLTNKQKEQLKDLGFNLESLHDLKNDHFFMHYQLGMLSQVFTKVQMDNLSFPVLKEMIQRGEYVKLNEREQFTLKSLKNQFLGDIRAFQGRIFTDVNNIITTADKNNREAYERVIRKELTEGYVKRKSRREIASDLGHKTGDWARNWNRIVQYQGHLAFDEGRAAVMERKHGDDCECYKTVYPGACKHCIRLYLTRGIGSEPKVFKLSELKSNGTNIGRKVDEWLPVIGPVHPFCRCTLHLIDPGEVWDDEKKRFTIPKDAKYETKRGFKIPIMVGDKKYMV